MCAPFWWADTPIRPYAIAFEFIVKFAFKTLNSPTLRQWGLPANTG
jgi:hypothetical protein